MSDNFHLQLYRGTTAQNNAYTGPAGELTVDTTLSKLRLHDGSTAGGVEIGGMPTGSIIPYAGSTAPAGYLLCDGSAISRSTYSALFAIIGTTYGEGDGNSTFNLPVPNDFPCGMPSAYYKDLTLDVSGKTYTAPANGWFIFQKVAGGTDKAINVYNFSVANGSMGCTCTANNTNVNLNAIMPVQKGHTCYISYSATGTTKAFCFVYDQGTPSMIKY